MRPAGACIAVATLGMILAGCGSGGGSAAAVSKGVQANEQLVTEQEIQRLPPDSPQQVLLRWWRAIQYDDLPAYLGLLSPPLRHQRELDNQARTDLLLASPSFEPAQPDVTSVEVAGDTATLYTLIVTREPIGNTRYIETRNPQAFVMVKEPDGWRIVDDLIVEERADAAIRAEHQAKTP